MRKEILYHGATIKKAYFEGWYYKITTNTISLAIILGVTKNTEDDHAFIQTLDTLSQKEQYIRYSISEMTIEDTPFHIQLGDNHFYEDKIIMHVDKDIKIDVEVTMEDMTPLNSSRYAPTIMGPFAYLPNMQCIHSICSLYHKVNGTININKQNITTKGAIGYIEKDRGTSFPKKYLWIQSNHSTMYNKACFFLSVATIPYSIFHFTGVIAILLINNKQHRFTTYYGARVESLEYTENGHYHITIKQREYKVVVKVNPGNPIQLLAPKKGIMVTEIMESLDARIAVNLYKNNQLIEVINFRKSGCEIRGYN